jgi:hypothetical protein
MVEWRELADLIIHQDNPPPIPSPDAPLISALNFAGPKGWLILAGIFSLLVLAYFNSVWNRPPLDYEFFNTKDGIMFRLTISEGKEFPYDEVIIRVTRVLGSDGSSYGAYYPLSKSELMRGR